MTGMRIVARAWSGLLLLALWSLLVPACAGAQQAPGEDGREPRLGTPVPLAGAIDPDRYRLGPGDVVRLALFGPISRQANLVVTPEGTLFVPELGALKLNGLTLSEGRQLVIARVRSALRGVGVEFQLVVPRTFRIYLTGELRYSGPRVTTAANRLADVLPDTLFTPQSSRRRIEVRSLGGQRWIADLDRFRLAGEGRNEPSLSDGDIVYVPVANQFLSAWGGVGREGRYELADGDSVGTLLQLAGGFKEGAIRDHALLVRWHEAMRDSLWLSLTDVGPAGLGMLMQDGDELHVYTRPDFHATDRIEVAGRVTVTGSYPIRSGATRLSNVLASAGGMLPDADSASVLLFRARPVQGPDLEFDRLSRLSRGEMTGSEYETFRTRLAGLTPDFRIDLRRVRSGSENDPLLMNGDRVLVARVVRSVRVDGQVRRPGVVDYLPGKPWPWYVRACGGLTTRSAQSQVRITRASSGQTLLARETDVPLAGDFLWVPERSDVPAWQYFRDTILVLGQVATVLIALRR